MRTITVKELGNNLPIGSVEDGKLVKSFALRPYKSWIDRVMNLWREGNPGAHQGFEVGKLISLVVEDFCVHPRGLTADKDTTAEQDLAVQKWFFGDVMYLYIRTRIAAVGSKLIQPFRCPVCHHVGTVQYDLNNMEVTVIDDPKELANKIALKDGIKLLTGRTCMGFTMQPVPFSTLLQPGTGSASANAFGYSHVREAIAGVDCEDGPYTLLDDELDEMTKRDVLLLDRSAGTISAGPSLQTEVLCPNMIPDKGGDGEAAPCNFKIENALDWSYGSFFDSSVPLESLTG
jgi:hypothetical protein